MEPRVSRGTYARFSVQSVHFQARIVGEEESGSEPAVVRRFQAGIFFERRAIFFRGSDGVEASDGFNADREQLARKAEFPQLSRVACGAIDLHASSIAAF